MKSFRLIFIDLDQSFSVNTTEAPVRGYMICRAPKGTTEARYFEYGNEKAINAMIGLQTANWPDIYEAIQFNQEYGLYISAPPGTSEEYPSYYGGVYLTTSGLHNYWRVDDKDNPSYEIQVVPGYESTDYKSRIVSSEIKILELSTTENTSSIIGITNVSAALLQKVSYMNFSAWEGGTTKLDDGQEVALHFVNGRIYPVVDDEDQEAPIGYYELTTDGTYTIILGATGTTKQPDGSVTYIKSSNTSTTNGVPYLDFSKLFNYVSISKIDTSTGKNVLDDINLRNGGKVGKSLVVDTLLNGLSEKTEFFETEEEDSKSITVSPFTGLKDRIFFRVNIKDETFMRISQKSPNETPTLITIDNIGYDRYKYDINVQYVTKSFFDSIKSLKTSELTSLYPQFLKDLIASNPYGYLQVVDDSGKVSNSWTNPIDTNLHALYQYDTTTGLWKEITSSNVTQSIYICGALVCSDSGDTHTFNIVDEKGNPTTSSGLYGRPYSLVTTTSENFETIDAQCAYTIWYVISAGKADKFKNKIVKLEKDSDTYPLIEDINFNTITLSCKEEVYPGSYTNGGSDLTGSLNEKGVDSMGSNIYWPNVLSPDDMSFIEVVPVNTFDDLVKKNTGIAQVSLDAKGNKIVDFWTAEKIVDPIGPAIDTYSFSIKGQRYCKHVNDENVKKGTLGCTWVDGYSAIINEGIIECQNNVYDDALIIMEPTGQEEFKSKLMSLRIKYRDTSTIIAPKMINKSEFNNPNTIVVAGRTTGRADYVGEFKMYDSYTGKYWWCQPIGDIGVNIARIMEKKLGGVAPAGTNDSSNLGGVLGRSVLDKKWDFNDSHLETLDKKGLNPITYDANFGLMIQSQKTLQDPNNETDWSYLGHSMSFDLCKREIRDNVMVQQAHKRISEYYYNIREKQVQAILDKRITGTDPIWAEATVDIAGQNNDSTKAQRKFMIRVEVKVYPYSNTVVLTFVNRGQE